MTGLKATELLDAWESGAQKAPVRGALALLAAAWPEQPTESWGKVPIGERDARLLALREELFGSAIAGTASCANCGERLELDFTTSDIAAPHASSESMRLEVGAYRVEYRVPNTEDLLDAANGGGAAGGRLLARCIQSARFGETSVESASLPSEIETAVIAAIAEADPQADVEINLECSRCRSNWTQPFDIVSYLWCEIEDWAQRTLREIHVIASVYGWSEREILSLSSNRRRLYFEMAREQVS